MQNLCRRIEALEKIAVAMRQERREIVERAILRLTYEELLLIMGAYFADQAGRVPTEEESAALRRLVPLLPRSAVAHYRNWRRASGHWTSGTSYMP